MSRLNTLKAVDLMTILDKLIEKKDLMIYIDMRVLELKIRRYEDVKKGNPSCRERAMIKLGGRIEELAHLKQVVHGNKLKIKSLELWEKNKKSKTAKVIR